jgi:hypothetical protein
MGKGILHEYQKLSAEDRRTFNRWMSANAILATVFAAGIVAMAIASSNSREKSDAVIAANSKPGTALPRPIRANSKSLSPPELPACCR